MSAFLFPLPFAAGFAAGPLPANLTRKAVGQQSAHGGCSGRSVGFSKPDIQLKDAYAAPADCDIEPMADSGA
jgi:hypothetical protein